MCIGSASCQESTVRVRVEDCFYVLVCEFSLKKLLNMRWSLLIESNQLMAIEHVVVVGRERNDTRTVPQKKTFL